MRIAWVADVHLGNHKIYGGELKSGVNDRASMVLASLKAAYNLARDAGCKKLFIVGDLFDTSKPSPQLITAVMGVVMYGGKLGIHTYAMLGNHDMESAALGDHAMGPLVSVATVLEKPEIIQLDDTEVWAVPFQAGKAEDWLPLVLAEVGKRAGAGSSASSRVLALHLGLRDGKTPPWLVGSHDSIGVELVKELQRRHDIDAVFAGNWHNPATWGSIVQIGTLCPTGFDNPGTEFGTMAVYDSKRPKDANVLDVPGPRFLKLDDAAGLEGLEATSAYRLYVRVKCDLTTREATEQAIAKAVEQERIVAGEAVVDTHDTQVALRQAAGATRSAESVDEAVAAFVKAMPLDGDSAFRAEVLAKVKQFLGGAT